MFKDSLLFKSEPLLDPIFDCYDLSLLNLGKRKFPVCCIPLSVVSIGGQKPFLRFFIEVVDSFWCGEHISNDMIANDRDANAAPSKHNVNSNVRHPSFSLLLIE